MDKVYKRREKNITITFKDYYSFYLKNKESLTASNIILEKEPQFLFEYDGVHEEWMFNFDNYNGCDILKNAFYNNKISKHYDYRICKINNTTHIFIFIKSDVYEISYENKEQTHCITKNKKIISVDEYLNLCNMIGVNLEWQITRL